MNQDAYTMISQRVQAEELVVKHIAERGQGVPHKKMRLCKRMAY